MEVKSLVLFNHVRVEASALYNRNGVHEIDIPSLHEYLAYLWYPAVTVVYRARQSTRLNKHLDIVARHIPVPEVWSKTRDSDLHKSIGGI